MNKVRPTVVPEFISKDASLVGEGKIKEIGDEWPALWPRGSHNTNAMLASGNILHEKNEKEAGHSQPRRRYCKWGKHRGER